MGLREWITGKCLFIEGGTVHTYAACGERDLRWQMSVY